MFNRLRSLDAGLLTLRISIGGFMLFGHGWGKLKQLFDGGNANFPDPLGIGVQLSFASAALAESVAAALIVVGLVNRLSTGALAFTMAVAAFVVHGGDPFAKREMALLYLAGCVVLLLTGPGRYTLQAKLFRQPSNKIARWLLQ